MIFLSPERYPQCLGRLYHLAVRGNGLHLADGVFQGDGLYVLAFKADHLAEFTSCYKLNRLVTEPRSQYPVESAGSSSPLDMAEYSDPDVNISAHAHGDVIPDPVSNPSKPFKPPLFSRGLSNYLPAKRLRPLCNNNYGKTSLPLESSPYLVADLSSVKRYFRNKNYVGAARY